MLRYLLMAAGLLAVALGVVGIFLPILPGLGPAAFAVLPIVVTVGAIWGDLFKSALKREVGVKDAGTLLPGFGGILDRIDSFIVAVPLVYYAVVLTGFLGLGAGLG